MKIAYFLCHMMNKFISTGWIYASGTKKKIGRIFMYEKYEYIE